MAKDTQDFKANNAYNCKRPMNQPMPMSNPVGIEMAMNNTFHGMPAYPNQYIFEGITQKPLRVTKVYKNE